MLECKRCGKQYNMLPTSDINLCPVCSKIKKKRFLFTSGIINLLFISVLSIMKLNLFKYLNTELASMFNILIYVTIFIGVLVWIYVFVKYFSE